MKKLLFAVFCISFSLFSCNKLSYKDDIPDLLGVENIIIKDSKLLDEFGGFGEGKRIEIYSLSNQNIQDFLHKQIKELPDKNKKYKYNWSENIADTTLQTLIDISLNYWGGKKITSELADIKNIINTKKVFISSYYNNQNVDLSDNLLLFILNIEENKLYIVDTMI